MNVAKVSNDATTVTQPGQTIFHPDDGVTLSLVQVRCATCQGPNFLYPRSCTSEEREGVQLSVYLYTCSNASCPVQVSFQVAQGQVALPPSLLALQSTAPQTIFHPDDGIRLADVAMLCEACQGVPLQPLAKEVEDLQSGVWTAYTYGCQHEGCPTRLILRVCHDTGKAGAEA